jgi:hydroxycarboxylate dehydrogenase B
MNTKLYSNHRVLISTEDITGLAYRVFLKLGCNEDIAMLVATHLVETSLMGVESHGVMRMIQYAKQFENADMLAHRVPQLTLKNKTAWVVDGQQGIGIPALKLAVENGCTQAKQHGMSTTAIVDCGHTGRLGAFVEYAAQQNCLAICIGGGGRKAWRQVAPYGGTKAMLPTNPYAIGIPGGERGPVVIDFATSKIAGGWIYAAKSGGMKLPEGCVIDANGNPTTNPDDYFNGGAILPAGGVKGYGLALMAELIGEAMLGPATTEINWLLICIDTGLYRDRNSFREVAEEILEELRSCPPAEGFARVEIPGERERQHLLDCENEGVALPFKTWQEITQLAERLEVDTSDVQTTLRGDGFTHQE